MGLICRTGSKIFKGTNNGKKKSKPQEYKQTLLLYLAGNIPWFPDHGLLTSRHRTVASPKRTAVASKIFRTCTGWTQDLWWILKRISYLSDVSSFLKCQHLSTPGWCYTCLHNYMYSFHLFKDITEIMNQQTYLAWSLSGIACGGGDCNFRSSRRLRPETCVAMPRFPAIDGGIWSSHPKS